MARVRPVRLAGMAKMQLRKKLQALELALDGDLFRHSLCLRQMKKQFVRVVFEKLGFSEKDDPIPLEVCMGIAQGLADASELRNLIDEMARELTERSHLEFNAFLSRHALGRFKLVQEQMNFRITKHK